MKIINYVSYLLSLILIIIILFPLTGRMNETAEISIELQDTLSKLSQSGNEYGEVPSAAVLLYNQVIIAASGSSVGRDMDISKHAEINCINIARQKLGVKEFTALDRSKLLLVVETESCAMCRAALASNKIHNIRVINYQPLHHSWYLQLQSLRVFWNQHPAKFIADYE